MKTKTHPLLCELHAHTTWSDGKLALPELVDLYGCLGFDVLCVSDHVVPVDDPWIAEERRGPRHVHAGNFEDYLAAGAEAERAHDRYGLLVLPGVELSDNQLDPMGAAHAVAVGVRDFVAVDRGIERAMREASAQGAAIIAAHPYAAGDGRAHATTQRFGRDWRELGHLVHRYELFNQFQLFPWVAEAGLAGVASGDFHFLAHLPGWKTLLPCGKEPGAVVDYLRSPRPVFLTRLEPDALAELAA